ncbi:cytochrome c oxidase assembly protein [Ancylobacter sp. A5.8]|uniref:cytochrome c oxidase assembly protein n=1 Tax=Ancylobacter gelatini TaxID=2919920 RepID=UPI001F4DE151|nr:cytochrome c oxidase assembly protein [Ancylobacter gelatini]MCJ8142250.1 cytochrome c oxidase assembly protein [Ancylobacter gelatini]
MKAACLIAGLVVLVLAWGGPLPGIAAISFSAHMVMHMSVVALAAPLIAIGLSGTRLDPSAHLPWLFSPVLAAMLEFAIVWGWHLPLLHVAARQSGLVTMAEQASFLVGGLLLWLSCLGRAAGGAAAGAMLGTLGLLLTSMHMTLLGALIAFANRPLYVQNGVPICGADPASAVADQQLGGVIMLLAGGLVYLVGGLGLMARVVLAPPAREASP